MENSTKISLTDGGVKRPESPFYSMDDLMLGTDIRRPEELSPITYDDLKELLTDDCIRQQIELIRNTTDKEQAKKLKLELPYFVGGIFDGCRKNDRMLEMHYMVFDYDNVPDIAQIKEKALPALDFIGLAFASPNLGLKLVAPFSAPVPEEADYRLLYAYYQKRCDEVLKLKSDPTCDPARACFVSYDKDYYENKAVNKISPEIALQVAIADNVRESIAGLREVCRPPLDGCRPSLDGGHMVSVSDVPAFAGTTDTISEETKRDIISASEYCSKQRLSYEDWTAFGMALKSALDEEGKDLWLLFLHNPHFPNEKQITLERHWASFTRLGRITYKTIFYIARKYGWPGAGGLSNSCLTNGKQELTVPKWKTGTNGLSNSCLTNGKQELTDPKWRTGTNGLSNSCLTNGKQELTDPKWKTGTTGLSNSCLTNGKQELTVPKLSDFPDLLELFGKPVNIPLEKDKLPGFLQDYLHITSEITDAQDGAKLTALLPILASNIGNRVFMYNAGTQHFCNIWAAIIGPSTIARKTTVIGLALKAIKRFQDGLAELSPKERNEQDITLTRVTQARLFNLLAKNPNRLIVQMELAAWMQEMNKTYNAGMKQDLTNMFDGRDMSIAKMEIDEHICKPAFSIIGATTEDWFFRELREIADQRGGFLQRFIICMVQNIDLENLNFNFRDNTLHDDTLYQMDEILSVFRSLPGSFRLYADEEAIRYRDEAYSERMKASAMTGNDPMASYCSRMYDNYWFRFCIIIWMMKHWREIKSLLPASLVRHPREGGNPGLTKVGAASENSMGSCLRRNDGINDECRPSLDGGHKYSDSTVPAFAGTTNVSPARKYSSLQEYFAENKVDITIADQAMYLCDYYFENTKPFLASMAENARLDGERKLIRILQKERGNCLTHSRLLNKSKMTSKEFRFCIESLIERQAIEPSYESSGNHRTSAEYTLNPVLVDEQF
jgi:hypothetical protein